MYLSPAVISRIEERYGVPELLERDVVMTESQLSIVKRGQRNGRNHDVTLFIADGEQAVMTRKPVYPVGAFRAPSGGVELGEDFEAGAVREAYEETGLRIRLERYLFRCLVSFRGPTETIPWTTHVLLAAPLTREIQPVDTHEIVEARWASFDEVTGPICAALLASGSPGLCYRAELDGLTVQKVRSLNLTTDQSA